MKFASCRAGILASILFALFFTLTGCNQQAQTPAAQDVFYRVKDTGLLRVGYVVLSPWVAKDPRDGKLTGAYIDLINEIGRQSNLKIEFVETTWANFAVSLTSNSFDMSIVPSYVTIQRANSIAFTRPISFLGNTAIVRQNDERFRSVYDLNREGVRVSVLQGEQGDDFARISLPRATISALSGGDQNLVYTEVVTGRSDAALGDLGSIPSFVSKNPAVKDIAPNAPYSVLPVSWAVRYQDQIMRSFLDSAIEYLQGSGVLAAVHKKWGVPGSTTRE